MAKDQSWLDGLLSGYKQVTAAGTPVTKRGTLNLVGATVADNPTTGATDVQLSGSAGIFFATLATIAAVDHQAQFLDGYATKGDGGGGWFSWNTNSVATEDGGTIKAGPLGTGAAGRWIRDASSITGAYNVCWFGADRKGVADSTTSILNANAAATSTGGYVLFPAGVFSVTGFTFNTNPIINWVGVGAIRTGQASNNSTSTIQLRSSADHLLQVQGLGPAKFDQLTFDGNFLATSAVVKVPAVTHQLAFTDCAITHAIPVPQPLLTGTVNIAHAANTMTASVAQTLSKGGHLVFSDPNTGSDSPNVYYPIAANVVASTTITIGGAGYNGPTNATCKYAYVAPLAGTLNTTNGSASVPTTNDLSGSVRPGDWLIFASQFQKSYPVKAVSSSAITLGKPYTGTGSATDNAINATAGSSDLVYIGANGDPNQVDNLVFERCQIFQNFINGQQQLAKSVVHVQGANAFLNHANRCDLGGGWNILSFDQGGANALSGSLNTDGCQFYYYFQNGIVVNGAGENFTCKDMYSETAPFGNAEGGSFLDWYNVPGAVAQDYPGETIKFINPNQASNVNWRFYLNQPVTIVGGVQKGIIATASGVAPTWGNQVVTIVGGSQAAGTSVSGTGAASVIRLGCADANTNSSVTSVPSLSAGYASLGGGLQPLTGLTRAPNATSIAVARNHTNLADIRVLATDGGDNIYLGDPINGQQIFVYSPVLTQFSDGTHYMQVIPGAANGTIVSSNGGARNAFQIDCAGIGGAASPLYWLQTTINVAAGGTFTLSAPFNPYITLTGSLAANVTIVIPAAATLAGAYFYVDATACTLNGHTISIQGNNNTWGTTIGTTNIYQLAWGTAGKLYGVALTP
jgi:hypothetical protein